MYTHRFRNKNLSRIFSSPPPAKHWAYGNNIPTSSPPTGIYVFHYFTFHFFSVHRICGIGQERIPDAGGGRRPGAAVGRRDAIRAGTSARADRAAVPAAAHVHQHGRGAIVAAQKEGHLPAVLVGRPQAGQVAAARGGHQRRAGHTRLERVDAGRRSRAASAVPGAATDTAIAVASAAATATTPAGASSATTATGAAGARRRTAAGAATGSAAGAHVLCARALRAVRHRQNGSVHVRSVFRQRRPL